MSRVLPSASETVPVLPATGTPAADLSLIHIFHRVGNSVDEETANAIITHLADLRLVTRNEAALMRAGISLNALALPINAKNLLRAAFLRNMLMQVFRNLEGGDRK